MTKVAEMDAYSPAEAETFLERFEATPLHELLAFRAPAVGGTWAVHQQLAESIHPVDASLPRRLRRHVASGHIPQIFHFEAFS